MREYFADWHQMSLKYTVQNELKETVTAAFEGQLGGKQPKIAGSSGSAMLID